MAVTVARGASALCLGLLMSIGARAADTWQSTPLGTQTVVNAFAGGSLEGASCPEGKFIVGLEIRSGTLVDAIGAECAKLGPNGEHQHLSQTRILGNSSGGSPRLTRCPAGQVITAVRARTGEFVDQVSFACRSWNATQGLHGSLRWQPKHGGSGGQPAGPIECPNGMGMTQVIGKNAGSYIARFWVACRTLPPTQSAPTTMSAQSALNPQGRPATSSPTSRPAAIPSQGITPATKLPQPTGPLLNAPVLRTLSSKPVAAGAEITIDGEHFTSAQVTRVEIAGQSVPYRVVSPTRITATVPVKVLDKLDKRNVPIVVTSGGQRISKQLPLR